MTIDELENRHLAIWDDSDGAFDSSSVEHTELSIRFTVEVLEKLLVPGGIYNQDIRFKIQELKQYLDEKV